MRAAPILAAVLAGLAMTGCASTHAIAPQLASGTDFSQADSLEVKLTNFDFSPSTLQLHSGKPYALKLVNTGSAGHDFTAPEFFAAGRVAPGDAAMIAKGQVSLEPGQTATIHIIPALGRYNLVCTHFGHAVLGMKGRIVVS